MKPVKKWEKCHIGKVLKQMFASSIERFRDFGDERSLFVMEVLMSMWKVVLVDFHNNHWTKESSNKNKMVLSRIHAMSPFQGVSKWSVDVRSFVFAENVVFFQEREKGFVSFIECWHVLFLEVTRPPFPRNTSFQASINVWDYFEPIFEKWYMYSFARTNFIGSERFLNG